MGRILYSLIYKQIMNNIGDCYYCKQPVFAAPGQAIKYKRIRAAENVEDFPTHKACRKGIDK